jgi:ABC-2 type transport system permease protein
MRIPSLTRKAWLETIRDWKILILTLAFAPLFVLLMYFYYQESLQGPYLLAIVNEDVGAVGPMGVDLAAGEELISTLRLAKDTDGSQIFEVSTEEELNAANQRLEGGAVDLVVHLPEELSQTLLDYVAGEHPSPVKVTTYGDPANANYLMAAVWSDMITYEFAALATGMDIPLELEAITFGGAATQNEFDLYVPSLLALAVMMLMFTAAAALIREKDKGTIIRLRLSNMTTFEWLTSVSLTQMVIGGLALLATYLTAVALGYQSDGSLLALAIVGLMASLSMIGISILVAAYMRTIFDLLTIGCFPFFILMFFSGGMFPLPPIRIFTLGTHAVSLNEILPTTHAITAMEKILNAGVGLSELGYELVAISILTLLYAALGVRLFTRRHMRATV